jgi:hypothetical protein
MFVSQHSVISLQMYSAPRARIKATVTLVRGVMARFQTRKVCKLPNVPVGSSSYRRMGGG